MKIEILPGVWMCDSKRLDPTFIEAKSINNIINVDKDLNFFVIRINIIIRLFKI